MKRKKPTLTERVAKLERECKRLRATVKAADDRTECAFIHARNMAEHVGRLIREKETLVRISLMNGKLPAELQR
jgi:2-methylisocitrate lyase-like PEP mutase family enzyme